jgi:hypothetical protein
MKRLLFVLAILGAAGCGARHIVARPADGAAMPPRFNCVFRDLWMRPVALDPDSVYPVSPIRVPCTPAGHQK